MLGVGAWVGVWEKGSGALNSRGRAHALSVLKRRARAAGAVLSLEENGPFGPKGHLILFADFLGAYS